MRNDLLNIEDSIIALVALRFLFYSFEFGLNEMQSTQKAENPD